MLDNEPTDNQSTTTEQDARETEPGTGGAGTAPTASAADAAAPAIARQPASGEGRLSTLAARTTPRADTGGAPAASASRR